MKGAPHAVSDRLSPSPFGPARAARAACERYSASEERRRARRSSRSSIWSAVAVFIEAACRRRPRSGPLADAQRVVKLCVHARSPLPAGVEHRRIYDGRHTFASWAIAGGVQLFYLARIMGTSVAQIDATYGHLLPDSEEYLRGLLDDYDAAAASS